VTAVAAVVAAAAAHDAALVVRGGGTKLDWGAAPDRLDLVLDMSGMSGVTHHYAEDLVVTVAAGTPLAAVQAVVARAGQRLAIDGEPPEATVGGLLAAGTAGPLRLGHGTPRDQLLGAEFVRADGTVAKAGGRVVKNVAGYDIGKLVSGSHGSLAAIVSATFKLMPLPGASTTLIATFQRAEALVDALAAITSSQLEAAAIEVRSGPATAGPCRLLLKFESTPGALNAHVQKARTLVGDASCDVVSSQSEFDLWREHVRAPWVSPGMIIKFAWLPASLGTLLALLDDLHASVSDVELTGRAAIGSGLLRVDADRRVQRNVVERLRSRTDVFRHVVVLRADAQLKQQLDVWGPLGDAGTLGASVKHALDPHGILNAGRGPV